MNKLIQKIVNNCTVCGELMVSVLKLPNFPLTEILYDKKTYNKKFNINQEMLFCKKCVHLSLKHIVNQDFIYKKNYIFKSKGTKRNVENYLLNFKKFIQKNENKKMNNKYLIDIGGNDSTFLSLFNNKQKINIDPNGKRKKNVKVYRDFFENINFEIFKKYNKVYLSSHTIEHLPDIKKLIQKMSESMKKRDSLYIQIPSAELFIDNSRFDQITHQHLNLYSLKSISKLLAFYNLEIKKFEYDKEFYGTIRLMVKKSKNKRIYQLNRTAKEIKLKFINFKKYHFHLNNILKTIKKPLYGFGAGITVPILNYFMPEIDKVEYFIDHNKEKNNKYFLNMSPQIRNVKDLNNNNSYLITSISTESTLKLICKKFIEEKIDFIVPRYKI